MFKTSPSGRREVLIGCTFLLDFYLFPAIFDIVILRISETFTRSMSTLHIKIALYQVPVWSVVKGKGKVRPITGHEVPEWE